MPTTAVLGGGLSGLCSAYFLSRALPASHRIVVLEKSKRFGGWIETLHRKEDGVSFETGPRSIRPVGLPGFLTLQMINELGLAPSLVTVSKSHPAAKNRFIYYPDRLTKAPSSLASATKAVLTPSSPFYGLLSHVAKEPFLAPPSIEDRKAHNGGYNDETVDSFISRRFGPQLATNVLSALVHGIYAGDTRQLSMRAVFPSLWNLEQKYGSIIKGMIKSRKKPPTIEELQKEEVAKNIPELAALMKDVSVYSLTEGIEMLPKALIRYLRELPNVEMRSGCSIQSLEQDSSGDKGLKIVTDQDSLQADHVVSAFSSSTLAHLTSDLPALTANPSVTVGVVNLAFPSSVSLPVQGFGYLIPRSVPASHNPHKVLGVIFDSDTFPSKDGLTKVTVMMGGHYWNVKNGSGVDKFLVPKKEDLPIQALETLRLHGLVPNDVEPVASHAQIQAECIPQYAVGHVERMQDLNKALQERYKGRLGVVGSSYSGVGINDCVLGSWRHAKTLVETGHATGLEHYNQM